MEPIEELWSANEKRWSEEEDLEENPEGDLPSVWLRRAIGIAAGVESVTRKALIAAADKKDLPEGNAA